MIQSCNKQAEISTLLGVYLNLEGEIQTYLQGEKCNCLTYIGIMYQQKKIEFFFSLLATFSLLLYTFRSSIHLEIFSFFFSGPHLQHMEFLGQGSDPSQTCDPHCSCFNTGSLTHCARLGIEPVSWGCRDSPSRCATVEKPRMIFIETKTLQWKLGDLSSHLASRLTLDKVFQTLLPLSLSLLFCR